MDYSRGLASMAKSLALAIVGGIASAAWERGLWATLFGALLVLVWVLIVDWSAGPRAVLQTTRQNKSEPQIEPLPLRRVLDEVPVPILMIEQAAVQSLNRAARTLFGTDDRVLPAPAGLLDPLTVDLLHEQRRWRVHRVKALGSPTERTIVTLVDVEEEERAAEVRVSADMIQVLGHELLNGLAPILSLAESGQAAVQASPPQFPLLSEILNTLARRTEALLRFTEAYRAMARLPEPTRASVRLSALADDLRLLFRGHWSEAVTLCAAIEQDISVAVDRDQLTQALWSIIQNGAEAALAAEAHPRVELSFRFDSSLLIIEVSDSGGGIDAEATVRIFRPFQTTKMHGTGIGLSLARQIARAHGGDLTLAKTRPATFRMSIPLQRLS